jgi:glycosyltransferase involved in cell wall biosynthesis
MTADGAIVTVVMPVFNGAAYLADAVASLGAESRGRLRAVLVDDGSSDGSRAMIAAMARDMPWIVPVYHDRNRGIGAARNSGLARADTPFVGFIDQDDLWAEGRLDAQLAALAADPALDFVAGLQTMRIAAGLQRPRWAKDRYFDGPQPGYVFGAILARRHCFERTGPLREELRFGTDDVDWFARADAAGLRHVMLERTVLYRILHDRNHSRMTREHNAELLRVMRDVIRTRRPLSDRGK